MQGNSYGNSIIPTVVIVISTNIDLLRNRRMPLTVGWMGSRSTAAYLLISQHPTTAENYGNKVKFVFDVKTYTILPNMVVQPSAWKRVEGS
jgi:hypothetical protein